MTDENTAATVELPTELILLATHYTLDDIGKGSPFRKSVRAAMLEELAEACEDAATDLIEIVDVLGVDGDTPVTLAFDEDGFVYAMVIEADLDDDETEELIFVSPALPEGDVSPAYLMYLTTVTISWGAVKAALEDVFDTDGDTLVEEDPASGD